MSQLPELEFGTKLFCVLRSAIVSWLHFELGSVIGVASPGPSTGNGPAELVSGSKSENLVLSARTGSARMSASANASGTRLDMISLRSGQRQTRKRHAVHASKTAA